MTSQPQILLYTKRNSSFDNCFDDCQYFGSVFLADSNGVYKNLGLSPDNICYMRSLAKPLQTSIMADCNIINDYNLSSKEVAIMCASHAGSPIHIEIIKKLIKKLKIQSSMLELMPASPLDMRFFKGRKTKYHNNCSAKHIMMIAMCKYLGFDYKGYANHNHPIQKLIKKKQENLSGFKSNFLSFDGCSTPLWGLPFTNIIKAYFNFFHNEEYSLIINSILKNPYIFGGWDRLDTKIIQKSSSKLFCKVGAGGLVLVYNFEKDEILLLKMSQNNNYARELILFDILNKINWLNCLPEQYEYNQKGNRVAKYCYEFN